MKYKGQTTLDTKLIDHTYARMLEKERAKGNRAVLDFTKDIKFTREETRNIRRRSRFSSTFQNDRRPCYYCHRRFDDEFLDNTFNDRNQEVEICVGCQRKVVESEGD